MKKPFTRLSMIGALVISTLSMAQTGKVGINTDTPRATLEIKPSKENANGTTNEGIIIPILSKSRLAKIPSYKLVDGTLVFVNKIDNDDDGSPLYKVKIPGFYYYYRGNEAYGFWDKLTTNGIERVSINGNTGWRLNWDFSSEYYRGIGNNAVDLSFKNWNTIKPSGIEKEKYGALGWVSVAMGYGTIASGDSSTAMGYKTEASGHSSTAIGYETEASGRSSTAMGYGTIASGENSLAMGRYNHPSDKNLLSIGNGSDSYSKRNVFVIDYNGNVAIGKDETAGSGAPKLEVNGDVKADTFRASNGSAFPDYVFQEYYTGTSPLKAEYDFKGLDQVEDFVKTNGHLPGYQSAKEVKEQGYIDIVDTQLTNVEKIEELYLHSIEQEKAIKAKDTEIKELKTELAAQKARLDKLEKLLIQ